MLSLPQKAAIINTVTYCQLSLELRRIYVSLISATLNNLNLAGKVLEPVTLIETQEGAPCVLIQLTAINLGNRYIYTLQFEAWAEQHDFAKITVQAERDGVIYFQQAFSGTYKQAVQDARTALGI